LTEVRDIFFAADFLAGRLEDYLVAIVLSSGNEKISPAEAGLLI